MSNIVFNYGSWAWVPDEEYMFVPGKVTEPFEAGQPAKIEVNGKV